MTPQTDRAYVTKLMDRLRSAYADRALLPSGETMSLILLRRLYHAIASEGYGL